jgi:cytochrome c oxidase subunit 2
MLKEWSARIAIFLGLALVVAIPILHIAQGSDSIVMHARMAESGGWTPESLTVAVGEPLKLRLTSDDVTHGFAVGQLDQPAVEVKPGEMIDITLVFSEPGKYTFYCTRWCSLNHWRMRGTIEVVDPISQPEPARPPLYVELGLDIDADHQASRVPARKPAAWRGALLKRDIPSSLTSRDYYLSHTPLDMWSALRGEPANHDLSDQQVWDLVAWVWQSNITPGEVKTGQELFTANCAACHGEAGAGDGVFAGQLARGADSPGASQMPGEHTQQPANFTDPVKMLSVNPAHLQGKIIRGGMGTGMPSWGSIFTSDQTWALVSYLWTYPFNLEAQP